MQQLRADLADIQQTMHFIQGLVSNAFDALEKLDAKMRRVEEDEDGALAKLSAIAGLCSSLKPLKVVGQLKPIACTGMSLGGHA